MKETLEAIIKNLVSNEAEVSINQIDGEKDITLEVKVASGDMGKVIGRQGKIAKSIRTIVKAVAAKEQKKVNVEFID